MTETGKQRCGRLQRPMPHCVPAPPEALAPAALWPPTTIQPHSAAPEPQDEDCERLSPAGFGQVRSTHGPQQQQIPMITFPKDHEHQKLSVLSVKKHNPRITANLPGFHCIWFQSNLWNTHGLRWEEGTTNT